MVKAITKGLVIVPIAFLLSAAVPVVLLMSAWMVVAAIDGGTISDITSILDAAPFIFFISLVFVVIFGVPSYLVLWLCYGCIDWVDAIWCGMLGGVVVALFTVGPTHILPLSGSYKPISLFILLGIASGYVFWLVLKVCGVNARD
jgi:hypothetical protein